jgi:hypothetical protein
MDLYNPRIAPIFTKLLKPIPELEISLNQIGLYGLPDQYFQDSQVTEFEYNFHFSTSANNLGEVKPRLKTEEEIWQEEQFKLNKGKKRKPGEEIPKEELEKLAYFEKIKKADDERLAKLESKERFYDIKEDNYKSNMLVWKLEVPESGSGKNGVVQKESFLNNNFGNISDSKNQNENQNGNKTA